MVYVVVLLLLNGGEINQFYCAVVVVCVVVYADEDTSSFNVVWPISTFRNKADHVIQEFYCIFDCFDIYFAGSHLFLKNGSDRFGRLLSILVWVFVEFFDRLATFRIPYLIPTNHKPVFTCCRLFVFRITLRFTALSFVLLAFAAHHGHRTGPKFNINGRKFIRIQILKYVFQFY